MSRVFMPIILVIIFLYMFLLREKFVTIERFTDSQGRAGQKSRNKDFLFLAIFLFIIFAPLTFLVRSDLGAVVVMLLCAALGYIIVLIVFLVTRRRSTYYAEDMQSFVVRNTVYFYSDIVSYKIDFKGIRLTMSQGKKVFVSLQDYRPLCLLGALWQKEAADVSRHPQKRAQALDVVGSAIRKQCALLKKEDEKAGSVVNVLGRAEYCGDICQQP